MDNLKTFEKVLRLFVLPMFPLIGDVTVEYERFLTHDIKITYYIVDRMDYADAFKVEAETKSLLNMMGFEKVHNPWITYRSVEQDKGGREFYSR